MHNSFRRQKQRLIMPVSIGILFWLFDAVVDFSFFYEGSFIDIFILDVPRHEIYMRVLGMVGFIFIGLYIESIKQKLHAEKELHAELKKSESKLHESENQLRFSFEESNIGMCMVDLKGNFIKTNKLLTEMFGYSNDELREKTFTDITHPDDIEIGMELFKKMLSGEKSNIRFNKRYIGKTGKTIICNVSGSLIRSSDNEPQFIIAQLMDITEHKEAEDKIRDSQKLFASIFNSSPIPIAMTTASDGKLIMINKSYEKLFKCTSEDVVGKTTVEVGFLKDDETRSEILAALDTDSKMVSAEAKIHDLDGNLINCLLSVEKIDYQNEEHVLVMVIDISELMNAENKLRQNETFIKTVLDNLPIGIAVNSVDPTVDFDYMNDNFPVLYRTTRDKLADSDAFWNVVFEDPDYREKIKKRVLDGCASGDPKQMKWEDVVITRKGEETSFIIAQNTPIPDNKLMISTVQDVTERKNAEEMLLHTQFSMDKTRDAVYWMGPDARFTYVNDSATEALGYTREELLAMSVHDIGPEYPEDIWLAHWKELREKGSFVFESVHKRKDGSLFPVELSVNYMKFGDKEYNCAFARDISERKAAEEKIHHSLKEKEVLLKEVHHRVKNNMAVISSLLSLQSGYIDDEKSLSLFRESQGRIHSMAIVHEKLYQSKDFAHIDIQDYINSLVQKVKHTYVGKQEINTSINVEEVDMDIDNLIPCGLMINEILTNAFKYAFNGIDSPEISISMVKAGEGNVSLTIRDNGIGLPEGFDTSKSSGLGLRLVHTLAKQLDGQLDFISDNGTTFTLTFPEKLELARHLPANG